MKSSQVDGNKFNNFYNGTNSYSNNVMNSRTKSGGY